MYNLRRRRQIHLNSYFLVSNCQRRIEHGEVIPDGDNKRYAVYLVRAPRLEIKTYDSWICGGAIIASEYVLTSAACIKDIEHVYVIAGYNKYVRDDQLDTDRCTQQMRKRVIFSCFPQYYEIDYGELNKWAQIDIGVVKIDSAFNFEDTRYIELCSYIPAVIPVNYEAKFQEPDTDAMVLGWGHRFIWRKEKDKLNYNQEHLNWASVLVTDKETCKPYYEDYQNMSMIIDKYMICTLEKGRLDSQGRPTNDFSSKEKQEHCDSRRADETDDYCINFRRSDQISNQTQLNQTTGVKNKTDFNKKTTVSNTTTTHPKTTKLFMANDTILTDDKLRITRRNGICQNDHGGPLVTWIGSHEVLIGVASVFRVSEKYRCVGPYLYTSTMCNSAFIYCILERSLFPPHHLIPERRSLCKNGLKGGRTVEKHISWLHHPRGPADNEKPGNSNPPNVKKNKEKGEYVANDQYNAAESYAVYGVLANEKNIENDKYVPQQDYAAPNEKYPAKETNQEYEKYGVIPSERYVDNKEYIPENPYAPRGLNQENIRNVAYGVIPNERTIENGEYKPQENYAAKEIINGHDRYPYERNTGLQKYVPQKNHKAIETNTGSGRYGSYGEYLNIKDKVNEKYVPQERYEEHNGEEKRYAAYGVFPTERYADIEKYLPQENYEARDTNIGNERYAAYGVLPTERYTGNEKYLRQENYEAKGTNIGNERYAAYGVLPTERYTENKYLPRENYGAKGTNIGNERYAAYGVLPTERYTGNEKHLPQKNYGVAETNIGNERHAAYDAENGKVVENNKYETHTQYPAKETNADDGWDAIYGVLRDDKKQTVSGEPQKRNPANTNLKLMIRQTTSYYVPFQKYIENYQDDDNKKLGTVEPQGKATLLMRPQIPLHY